MPKIVVEGPDGKKYAFPDTMPREEINAFMKQRYGTKARNETVQDYLARVVREQDATKARARDVTREATAAGRAEGERAAERMGVDNPLMMAFAAPAIGLAQQSAGRTVYDREGTMLPDEAAALAAVNAAGFLVPGMVNKQFGERAAEGRRQQPGASFAGDIAGGAIGGEMISLGIQKAGQMIAPAVSQIGRLFKGKPAPEPPLTLGPESRIMPVDRPDAFPGDDVAMAEALDQWTPPVEQKMMPMGFAAPSGSGRRPIGFLDDLERGTDTFFDARLGPEGSNWNKAVEMAKNGYSNDEIAEAIGWTRDSTKEMLKRARNLGIDVPKAFSPGGIMQTATGTSKDILALREKGLTVRQISERTGKPSGTISSMLSQERARMKKAGEEIPAWLLPEKKAGASEGNLAENVFGAAYMSGTGSVGGMHIDFNGDGTLDEEDKKIGSLVGLAAFASPLALRKVAELGGRLKGTKALAGVDDITPSGFGSPAPRRTEAFMDDRLTPSENKALEMRRNGFSTEEIAEEMDTSTNTVLKFISTAKAKGVEVEPIKRGPPMNRTPDVLRLAEQGLRPNIIAERLGLTRNNVSVLLTKERMRLNKAGKPIPKWLNPRDPGGNIKETD